MTTPALPTSSRVVVIGGGIIGCSVAYHLAHMGCEVLLLERDRLTSGTTWHAAGLIVTFGSTSETSTEMRKYSRDLYTRLPAETGQETGFRPCGFIEVAADSDRLEEYRRVAAFNRLMGIDVHELSPREVGELFPLARVDDILAGFYVKEDGRANPVDVTMALAKGAKLRGAKIAEGVAVTGVRTKGGAVAGVQTTHGSVQCETVVNCAGMWARELGSRIVDANGRPLVSGVNAGVNIPLQAAEHYYLITGPIEAAAMEAANSAATQTVNSAAAGNSRGQRSARPFRDWPVLEDPASYGYFREEAGGLMIGLFEPVCAPWKVEGLPPNFSFSEIEPDWERMTPFLEKAMARVPAAQGAGIKKFFCGPESFTPDLLPIVGPAPELKNYFVAAGLNSIGILTGGGIGRLLAHWILTGDPQADVTGIHIDRLHRYQSNPEYRRTRTVESLGMVYQCHYPTRSMATARDAKRSPLHDRLAARGAWFKDVSGWEGADWYAPPGVPAKVERLSWGRQNWFPYWRAEHEAARSGVILMDMSFMSKFFVQGKDAGRVLNRLSANNVDAEPGRITYTQWLNERGTIEADLTVTKFDDEHFMVVASDTAHGHAFSRLQRGCEGAHAFAADMTGAYAQINIQGPRSRELLQSVTSSDISDDAFPFRCAREIDLALARVLAIRITYLGELGYELYVPAEQAVHVYERLVRAGEKFDLRHAGLKALASLRMEKGYRDYGHDIDNTDSVLEAGLGFAVDLAKPGGFIGRDAVLAKKAQGPLTRRLLQVLVLDPEPMMFHAEPIYRDGRPLGYVRAASYGHTLGGAVGLAMIDAGEPIDQAWCEAGRWEIDIAGRRYPARASVKPMYDAEMKRIRA